MGNDLNEGFLCNVFSKSLSWISVRNMYCRKLKQFLLKSVCNAYKKKYNKIEKNNKWVKNSFFCEVKNNFNILMKY